MRNYVESWQTCLRILLCLLSIYQPCSSPSFLLCSVFKTSGKKLYLKFVRRSASQARNPATIARPLQAPSPEGPTEHAASPSQPSACRGQRSSDRKSPGNLGLKIGYSEVSAFAVSANRNNVYELFRRRVRRKDIAWARLRFGSAVRSVFERSAIQIFVLKTQRRKSYL